MDVYNLYSMYILPFILLITAAVDQLLHTKVLVAHLLSLSDILLPLLINSYTQTSRLFTYYPHGTDYCHH